MNDKTYITLEEGKSIFHDTSQGATLTGSDVLAVNKTANVVKALRNGVIRIVTSDEIAPTEEPTQTTTETAPVLDPANTEQTKKDSETIDYTIPLKAELTALAVERGIEVPVKATKEEIIALLEAYDKEQATKA